MRAIVQIVFCAVLVAVIAGPLPAAATTTDLTVGDSLELVYAYPNQGTYYDTLTFAYTGPGQTETTQNGITELDIVSNNQIEFLECSYGCSQTAASYNGPILIDLSNSNAFSDWDILSDSTASGTISMLLGPGEIGVNWQGVVWPDAGGQVVLGATATPLPATLPLFATGLSAMGLFGWRRKRKAAAIAV